MTESEWTLDTEDGHKIYGVVAHDRPQPDAALFIVHGLTSSMDDYALKRAADFFAGTYAVYRFNLYDWQDGARTLTECTLDTHAGDLKRVLAEFAGTYKRVFLIGHSYGGLTILIANPENITAVSLWDPSFDLHISKKEKQSYKKIAEGYLSKAGVQFLIGEAMFEEQSRYGEEACIELAKNFRSPMQVVHAANGVLIKGKSYHSFCPHQTQYDVIAGTKHTFTEGSSCDDLLARTKEWFDSFE